MTTQDKTGDQLVASIRKSKTGAVTRKTAPRTAAKPAATRATTKTPTVTAKVTPGKEAAFSSGCRVWPD